MARGGLLCGVLGVWRRWWLACWGGALGWRWQVLTACGGLLRGVLGSWRWWWWARWGGALGWRAGSAVAGLDGTWWVLAWRVGVVAPVVVGALGWRAGSVVAVEVVHIIPPLDEFFLSRHTRRVATSPPSCILDTATVPVHTTAIPVWSVWPPLPQPTQDAADGSTTTLRKDDAHTPSAASAGYASHHHPPSAPTPPLPFPATLITKRRLTTSWALAQQTRYRMQCTPHLASQVLPTTSPHARQDNGATPSPPTTAAPPCTSALHKCHGAPRIQRRTVVHPFACHHTTCGNAAAAHLAQSLWQLTLLPCSTVMLLHNCGHVTRPPPPLTLPPPTLY
ncbi:hypothetical protein H4582DRAFT_2060407 [Lactarius indigo]|nr:hypothetical protein H4582DRAFT_2060407 [Lactarius indigo]